MSVITDRQLAVAGMLGRGYSERQTAAILVVSRGTIQRWKKEAAFAAEVERARENRLNPTPRGTLMDALQARRDDSVDWPSRVRASMLLLGLDDPDDDPDVEPGWVT